jgi:hypothetical protein
MVDVVRCPDCRQPIELGRWVRFPDQLVCYQCGELLHRSTRLVFADGFVIWVLAMLPIAAFFTLGGLVGMVVAGGLLAVLMPLRFWEGFRYALVTREPSALPPARAVVGAESTTSELDRGVDPQAGPPEAG